MEYRGYRSNWYNNGFDLKSWILGFLLGVSVTSSLLLYFGAVK